MGAKVRPKKQAEGGNIFWVTMSDLFIGMFMIFATLFFAFCANTGQGQMEAAQATEAAVEKIVQKLEEQEDEGEDTTDGTDTDFDAFSDDGGDNDFDFNFGGSTSGSDFGGAEAESNSDVESNSESETILPSPASLGAGDFTDANMEI